MLLPYYESSVVSMPSLILIKFIQIISVVKSSILHIFFFHSCSLKLFIDHDLVDMIRISRSITYAKNNLLFRDRVWIDDTFSYFPSINHGLLCSSCRFHFRCFGNSIPWILSHGLFTVCFYRRNCPMHQNRDQVPDSFLSQCILKTCNNYVQGDCLLTFLAR